MDDDPDDTAAVLARKRTELEAELARLTEPPGDQGSISFGKRVGEGTSQAVDRLSAVSAHRKLMQVLADVQRAQAKLDEGSYGECDTCGRDIGAGRLEVRPWASSCVSCAAQR
ncbi:MAG TPA: TraR/DksA C4-type zinc finger protein [Nocardioidaceae bacterium]|nr:TraR/DksA C4-type zinc finger protein [Nocardioidaceae bacterium]